MQAFVITTLGAQVTETAASTTVDTVALAGLLSLLVPLVVSAVTKQTASDGLRSVVNMIASALVAVLALWVNPGDGPVSWQTVVNTLIGALVVSLVAYKGFWKPTGVAGSVTVATSNFGIGPRPVLETDDKGAENVGQVGGDL
jgi:hypothetical protein